VRAVRSAERAEAYGANGYNMGLTVNAALKDEPQSRTLWRGRV
ncbi:hypothetical protein HKBW3S09_01563, partial [Candidatus Hakubella thermalkaliphila]